MGGVAGAEKPVLVVGGGGFYGRYVVGDLVRFTTARVVTIGRKARKPASNGRVRSEVCDLNDMAALRRHVAGSRLVIHCAGPFRRLPLNPLRCAIEAGVDYVDIAEDREYARRVRALAPAIEAAGITVLNGISVVPGMEACFTRLLLPYFDAVHSLRTFAAPDTRKHRGDAMFNTMLWGTGRRFEQLRDGRSTAVYGWSEPEWAEFPAPIGRRLTYLVLEMADLDVLPERFGLRTIEFKAGSERPVLNRLLGLAATLRVRTGHPRWEQYTPLVRAFSWLVGRVGKDEGAVIFEVGGLRAGVKCVYRVALVARRNGGRIPAVLAGMAAQELLAGNISQRGLMAADEWISSARMVSGLRQRGLGLFWQTPESAAWLAFPG